MDCDLPGWVVSVHGDDSEIVLPGGLSTWTVTNLDGSVLGYDTEVVLPGGLSTWTVTNLDGSVLGYDTEVVLPGGLSTWTVTDLEGLPPSMAMRVRLNSLVVSLHGL